MSKHHHGKKPQQSQPAEEALVNPSQEFLNDGEVPDGDLQSQEEVIQEFEKETEQWPQDWGGVNDDQVKESKTFDGMTVLSVLLQGERVRQVGTTDQWKAVPYYEERDKKHIIQIVSENGNRVHTPVIEYLLEKNWEIVPHGEWF